MRMQVHIPDAQLAELDGICSMKALSRADAVRYGIALFIEANRIPDGPAFGLWGKSDEDGLAIQERMRREW